MIFDRQDSPEMYVENILWSPDLDLAVVVLTDNLWVCDANFEPIWNLWDSDGIHYTELVIFRLVFSEDSDELTIFMTIEEDYDNKKSKISIYNRYTGLHIQTIPQEKYFSFGRTISKDKTLLGLFAYLTDATVLNLFDNQGNKLWQIPAQQGSLRYRLIASSSKYLITRSFELQDSSFKATYANHFDIRDVETGKPVYEFMTQVENTTIVAISPEGKRACSISDDWAFVWNLADGTILFSLEGFSEPTTTHANNVPVQVKPALVYLKWLPKHNFIAGYDRNTLFLWSSQDGSLKHQLEIGTATESYIAWSPDEKWVACKLDANETIGIWDLSTFGKLFKLKYRIESWDNLLYLDWRSDGNQLIGSGEEGSLLIWDTSSENPELWQLIIHHEPAL